LKKYAHFSIDDVYLWLREIHSNASVYTSLFDHPGLAFLKSLHDRFGAVATLNCFYTDTPAAWNLGQMTTRFKDEFAAHSNWLRLAFHANGKEDNYNGISVGEARTHYNAMMAAFENFASVESIDTAGRTHFFSGDLDNARVWRSGSPGARGFLTSDDSREVDLYLNTRQREILRQEGAYYDRLEDLYFVKSLPRLEKWDKPASDLSDWAKDPAYAGRMQALIFFTHEQCWDSGIESKLQEAFTWARDNGYEFAFPMDRIPVCGEEPGVS
jgi:hypothetical protein